VLTVNPIEAYATSHVAFNTREWSDCRESSDAGFSENL